MPFFASASALLRLSALTLCICIAPAACAGPGAPEITPASKAQAAKREAKKQAKKAAAKKAAKISAGKAAKAAPAEGEFANFGQWREVGLFIDDMVARDGFDRAELNKVFSKARYIDSAITLMKPAPPGRPKNWTAYRLRFVEPVRINGGVQFWKKYEGELTRAEEQYGVPADIIVAIIGVETIYGGNTGNFRVMDAITTLAFDYPDTPTRDARMQFFRGELENTLLFARESHIDPFSLVGSYAGAIGLPQFMPSSIRQYAVDFNGDGKIDLRNEPVDAIGSVAHFLSEHGWRRGLPTAIPVQAPADAATALSWQPLLDKGLAATYSPDELKAAGVVPTLPIPSTLPAVAQESDGGDGGDGGNTGSIGSSNGRDLKYGLVDLQNGNGPTEYWLGTDNFFAITKYNRSYFYAMSVIDLGKAIRAARQQ